MDSRSTNSLSNMKAGLVFKLVNLFLKFFMRTVFIYTLGQAYVGMNGVFGNILTVLALSELGLGAAIVYDIYKPIALGNKFQIIQLFLFYKKVYSIIGCIIFIIGLAISPFLEIIINDLPEVNNLKIIYLVTLINTVSGYFFAHYTSMIEANQKQNIISKYNVINAILKTLLETLILIIFKSYILYLIVELFSGLVINIIIAKKVYVMYPFLKEKGEEISISKVRIIMKNALGAFSLNVASTVVNATDNIIISAMLGSITVGSYSTYTLIVMSVQQVVYTFKTSVMASVGNLCASCDYVIKRKVFWNLEFLIYAINTIVDSCFLNLLTPFIRLWAGESYILDSTTVLFIVFNYFLRGTQWPIEVFFNADGIYRHFKLKPWIEVILNIFFSLILVKKFGIVGIVAGTTLSELLTTFWFDIFITNKYSLKGSLKKYWIETVKYFFVSWGIVIISVLACNFYFFEHPIIDIIYKSILSILISGVLYFMIFFKKKEMVYYIKLIKKLYKRTEE